jgi:rhodanese-related sulfurtransferase
MREISPPELARWLADEQQPRPLLLDVRQAWEYQLCHLGGSELVPLHTLPHKADELDRDRTIVCVCHHGVRSRQAVAFLEQQGFGDVVNLTGGIDAWSDQVDPGMPKY